MFQVKAGDKTATSTLAVRVPEDVLERLKKLAEDNDVSISEVVRQMVVECLD